MSASTAIGMVGESLKQLLEKKMKITPQPKVTLLAPDEPGDKRRVNLFLYKVQENPFFINADWQVKRNEPSKILPPPLSLNLFYLMTAYAPSDSQTGTGNIPAHDILGEAMRVFYENPIVPKKYLVVGLQEATEQIKIIQSPLDMAELSHAWSTFSQPFRLSVLYEISVLQIDQQAIKECMIAKRPSQIDVSFNKVPFQPPTIIEQKPLRGPGGTTVEFTGENLETWKANVTIIGVSEPPLAEELELTSNSFTVTIPASLPAGLYQIQVDISGLFRKTFFFEVTAATQNSANSPNN